ncbi:HAMP domain-containing sensor histidine kinase [Geothrix sp. PMB-07]|uniref:sensor histidine kinase n=1 Tax=Geothrix sp. PMB-07 TaxID=3068640 RepID=UPI0027427E31|nr:HAMP domain-containing sensor histidine kinase [Geothrix sp. PMB-07]WLT31504.1 HAMP domain-containing sensor histidine kinase [Geothrix sp. PMB-07]
MYRHRTSRYRILHPGAQGPGRWLRLEQRGALIMLGLAGLVTAALLAVAPTIYIREHVLNSRQAFMDSHWGDFEIVERHWKTLPMLQTVKTGTEPDVRHFLESQPLVVALLDRFEGRRLWLRQGEHLIHPGDSPQAQLYLGWLAHAEMAQRFEWNPPKDQDPDFGRIATVVLLSDRWLVLKRWEPGSPTVEQALSMAMTPSPNCRMGLLREDDEKRDDLEMLEWGRKPHIQADPARLVYYRLNCVVKTNAFGNGWSLGAIAFEEQERVYRADLQLRERIANTISVVVGLAIALGLWIRYRSRRRAVLDADRMAAMTHSLKTPLAILKFRCDSLRLGRLSPDRADEELLKIGEEVDHLTTLIESSLKVMRGQGPSGPRGQATRAWFQEVVEDLQPAFELEQRELELRLAPEAGHAPLPSLRAAVLTLLENALGHGRGRVTLETWRNRRRFCIQVTDEGEGLQPHQVKALGKPFLRIRERGKEGFQRDGQGLGLSLLIQVANQEGWGLSFASAPGEGFSALLEVPSA